jgi:hypothetical protein
MKMNIAFLTIILCVVASSAFGQKPTSISESPGKSRYADLLEELKNGDTKIDYKALRIAYSETKDASPYGADRDARKAMNAAFNQKKFKEAIKAADEILKSTYVNADAHAVESLAYRELGNAQKADFHKAVYLGLLNSIISGADGKTAQTAYVVISTDEEYSVMRALGYSVSSQSLSNQGGHTFDILTGTDPKANSPVKIFFNIDIVWKAETEMFNPK